MNFIEFLRILRSRFWVVLTCIAVATGVATLFNKEVPETYLASADVLVEFKQPTTIVERDSRALLSDIYMSTQIELVQSHRVALKATEILGLADSPHWKNGFLAIENSKGEIRDWIATRLRKNLIVNSRDSRIIKLSYEARSAEKAAKTTNAFAEAYRKTVMEIKVQGESESAEWFANRLAELREQQEAAQVELTNYQQESKILDSTLVADTSLYTSLTQDSVTAKTKTSEIRRQIGLLKTRASNETIAAGSEIMSNAEIRGIKEKITIAKARLLRVTEHHPDYRQVVSEVEALQAELDNRMRAFANSALSQLEQELSIAQGREAAIVESLDNQRRKVRQNERARGTLLPTLISNVEAARKAYNMALEQYNQHYIQSQADLTNVVLVTPAVTPNIPIKPPPSRVYLIAIPLGIFLGIGAALITEMINPRVRSEEDLRDLGLPIVGKLE